MSAVRLPLDLARHERHPLHGDDRAWPETNCYVDLWIEILHALDLDPVAALAFTVALDFEGDQWTFFKYPHADLEALFGIEVQELNVWRSVADHVGEQLALGRLVIVETDAWYLPDTTGTSYRSAHAKTSIAVHRLDVAHRVIGYFHNAGSYQLEGDDFDGALRLGAYAPNAVTLAPYAEIVKLDRLARPPAPVLADEARRLLRHHLARRPVANPFRRYADRFDRDLGWLAPGALETFHLYAFATLRQCGACAELAATFLRWLESHGEPPLASAASELDRVATDAKTVQFQLARRVNTGRETDLRPTLDAMAVAWERAMAELDARYGG
jgi:hypothetical protein